MRALAHLMYGFEGACGWTALAARLSSMPGLGSPADVITRVHLGASQGLGTVRCEVAALASLVCDMAAARDAESMRIVDEAATHLSALATRAMTRLGLAPIFYLAGGLLTQGTPLEEATSAKLKAELPGSDVGPSRLAPEDGCVLLAFSGMLDNM